jgi:hypothetical protein
MRGWTICSLCRGLNRQCGTCAGQGVILGDGPSWDERIATAELRGGFTQADCLSASFWDYSPLSGKADTPESQTLFKEFWRNVVKQNVSRVRDMKKQIDELG